MNKFDITIVPTTGCRDMSEVLDSYMQYLDNAVTIASGGGAVDDKSVTSALMSAVYVTYLQGVEDGMRSCDPYQHKYDV